MEAMNVLPSSFAVNAISRTGREPSLSVECTWRSAWGVASHAGSASSTRRTCAIVR